MRTERKEGRWADGEAGERARGRGRGRVTKAERHVERIPRGTWGLKNTWQFLETGGLRAGEKNGADGRAGLAGVGAPSGNCTWNSETFFLIP